MKKKLLIALLAITAAVCGILVISGCDNQDSEPQGEHNHFLIRVGEKDATCTKDGNEKYYFCLSCGKYYADGNGDEEITDKESVVIPKGHKMTHVEEKEATCTEDGNREFYFCDGCGKWYEDLNGKVEITDEASVIIPNGHKLTHIGAKGETCTEDGNISYYACTVCQKLFEDGDGRYEIADRDSVVLPKGHKLTHIGAKGETCTEDGNISYYTCAVCQKWFGDSAGRDEITDKESVVLPRHHILSHVNAKAATCKLQGNIEYYPCSRCNKYFNDEKAENEITDSKSIIIRRLPHDYEEKVCTACGIHEPTAGLEYYVMGDTCRVSGIGTATDSVIYIADFYDDKPVTSINGMAFSSCRNIESIIIPDGVIYINEYAFLNCTSLKNVVISDSVTYIGNYVFDGCASLENITIPDSVISIGGYLFYDCISLKSVTLSGSISVLDSTVFRRCSSLTDIYFNGTKAKWDAVRKPDGWDSEIGEYTVHCKDASYTAGHLLTFIKAKAATCTEDGYEDYYTCAYCDRWFHDEDAKEEIADKDSVVLAKYGHDMTYSEERAATCLESGHSAYYACGNCNKWFEDDEGENEIFNKTDVVIKKLPHSYENSVCTQCGNRKLEPTAGLKYTDKGDYYELSGLGNAEDGDIVIADEINGKPVTSIAANAFSWSAVPTSIFIPDSIISIGDGAFQGCGNVTSIVISDNLTSIGKNVFYGLGITDIVIPDGVTSIGEGAFESCSYLTSIVIPDNVTSIGNGAFKRCRELQQITIGSGVKSIGENAFEYCEKLVSIVIPDNVTSIGKEAFYNCYKLNSVTLSKNITSFGRNIFEYCSLLTDIYFDGTSDEWYDMIRYGSLGYIRSNYTIHCTDTDIFTYHPNTY